MFKDWIPEIVEQVMQTEEGLHRPFVQWLTTDADKLEPRICVPLETPSSE